MKMSFLLSLAVMFSLPTFAKSETVLKGQDAEILIAAFEKIGSAFDSGAGHIGTGISDLDCNVDKFSPTFNSCSLSVQDEAGEMVAKKLYKSQANILIEALTDVGIGGCGTENCGGFEAKSITCTTRLAPAEEQDDVEERSVCTIIQ